MLALLLSCCLFVAQTLSWVAPSYTALCRKRVDRLIVSGKDVSWTCGRKKKSESWICTLIPDQNHDREDAGLERTEGTKGKWKGGLREMNIWNPTAFMREICHFFLFVCMCVCTRTCACVYACMCVHVCALLVCMQVHMCVCVYESKGCPELNPRYLSQVTPTLALETKTLAEPQTHWLDSMTGQQDSEVLSFPPSK